jgi:hypothetical protein
MSEQPESQPTGEMVEGHLIAEEAIDPETGERQEVTEVHGDPIFIPRAWREELGLGQDDLPCASQRMPAHR